MLRVAVLGGTETADVFIVFLCHLVCIRALALSPSIVFRAVPILYLTLSLTLRVCFVPLCTPIPSHPIASILRRSLNDMTASRGAQDHYRRVRAGHLRVL